MPESLISLLRSAYLGTLIGGFLFFLAWEGAEPRRPFADAASQRRHRLRNFGMLFLVIVLADIAFGWGVMGTLPMVTSMPAGLFAGADVPWPLQLAIGFVALDFAYYWTHRALHAWPLLWRIHRVHHSDRHLDATTASRFHPLDVAITIVVVVGTLSALGIPLWVELARNVVITPLLMAQHANVAFSPRWDALLRPVIVTPELHRVHHSPLGDEHDSNYGQILSCWDRWFGTWREPPASVADVGVPGLEAEDAQSVLGMMLTPLRPVPRSLPD
jgi:sterol desaturase/sphingolipid hydroxylase (fatty acid hydroxylase superfamily)